ncbi:MAG TPA: energy transducer TonB [Terriglobia bacterium]|nr:energy transducer TonB [Terriglobia bacterium]
MFSTLLDSSPLREPVLRRLHWGLSLLAGCVCFGIALSILHARSTPQTRLAVIAAAAGLMCTLQTLMLCYVFADAARFKSRAWPWLFLTLVLSLPGFLIYLVYSARKTGDWKRAAIPMAYVFQIGLLCLLVMLPLIYTEALPESQWTHEILSPPTPPVRYHAASRPPGARLVHQPALRDLLAAPTMIPRSIRLVRDMPKSPEDLPPGNTGVPGGTGELAGVPYSLSEIGNSQPPPPPPPAKKQTTIVRLGGQVEAAKLIYGPRPEYPPLARMARVQGTVKLEALISIDGTIQGLKLISGPPLLTAAAMDAVARWRYQPTLLNGDPIEVQTEIDVVFTLPE